MFVYLNTGVGSGGGGAGGHVPPTLESGGEGYVCAPPTFIPRI